MRHTLSKGMLVTAAAASGILSLNGGSALAAESTAAGSPGILSGNSVQASVDAPVNVCGNSVDVVGIANPTFGNRCGNEDGGAPAGPAERDAHERATSGESGPRHEGAGPERTRRGRHAAPGPVRHTAGHEAGEDRAAPRGRHAAPAIGTSSVARGGATGSPGLLSGNAVQVPLDVPLNVCGNTVDVVALLNPAFGNGCGNGAPAPEHPTPRPPHHVPPHHVPPHHVPPRHVPPKTDEGDGGGTSSGWTGGGEKEPARLAETGADAGLLGVAGASATLLVGGAVLYRRKAVSAHR
ncbi:chaplin [Streptomyces sp. DSM 41982]|uniref:Chaplin n=1 Tax=Streptomyces evansiae TaxID=3075535 RepID=A0ABD5EAM4_9ACTN|nr:chaplin [Streptomyces sp. DSM 41982]MDT0418091.1 chaplin [Streptomyces sp. DSM 41982]